MRSHRLNAHAWLRKQQEQKQQKQALHDRAVAEARRIAGILATEYQAGRVYLFGPLSYGEFRDGMAIELAVDGLPPQRFAAALAHVRRAEPFAVELVNLDQVDGWTRRSILEKGMTLE